MKQFSCEISNTEDVAESLRPVCDHVATEQFSDVVVHIYSGNTNKDCLAEIANAVKDALPQAKIVGSTSGGEICAGRISSLEAVLVTTVFEQAEVVVREYRIEPGREKEQGRTMKEAIDATPDVKAVELLVDCTCVSTAALFPEINKCKSNVQIYGAVPYARNTHDPMFVFGEDPAQSVDVVLIMYAGKELFASTDYVIGWKPMGTSMVVTKASGSVLDELDGQPALSIYEKYLQIPNDAHFYENAFEFPLLHYSNAVYMMRLPYTGLPGGSIELRAPIAEGDIVYLSYGDRPTILSEVFEARDRMARFCPQFIRLHDCAMRETFWGPDIDCETQPFQELANTTGFLTGGEILRVNDELVHFNATLVVVGMREGKPDAEDRERMRALSSATSMETPRMSMVRRMANFVSMAMQELVETNRRLEVLAKSDALTKLNNRREMSSIISQYHNENQQFCLLMVDVDNFRLVNDTYGHDLGDRMLITVADLIVESVKNVRGAATGRWGGEEFIVLLPGTTIDLAVAIAEVLRENIETYDFGEVKEMTLSLGVVDSETYSEMRAIYHDADQALYAAKAAGKSTVILAGAL